MEQTDQIHHLSPLDDRCITEGPFTLGCYGPPGGRMGRTFVLALTAVPVRSRLQ